MTTLEKIRAEIEQLKGTYPNEYYLKIISEGFDSLSFWEAFKGCWMFDTSAILYTNVLYAFRPLSKV